MADDFGMDDVDAFHAEQDKIMLDQGLKRKQRRDDSSDEEVMDIDSQDSQDEEDDDSQDEQFFGKQHPEEDLESEEEGAWGDKKGNYYGADDIENEETAKHIEQEALRQQKKHLEQLNMDDYVDEEMEQEWTKSAKIHDLGDLAKDTKTTQSLQDLSSLDSSSKKKYLSTAHPEFIPLTKELIKWNEQLQSLQKTHKEDEVSDVKFIALSAYLGAISSYLAIFIALSQEDEPFSMKSHPVMESILSTKEVWRQANELEFVEVEEPQENEDEQASEVEEIEEEVYDSASEDIPQQESDSEEEEEDDQEQEDSDLDIDVSKPRIFKKVQQSTITEDFAEGEIAEVDAEEKKRRKKTLRFYTSKIDQQGRKKDEKYGGDEDLPYKERLFERQQRLIEEARQRGMQHDGGAELDDYESDHETNAEKTAQLDDSLYQSVKSSKDESKLKRREAHDMAVRAAKDGRLAELQEIVGDDGKRAVNYQILKNKGLTPHRNKDNRNSRVKKRKKYEKAQKKLKSVRAVFEQPKGAYDGEKTGIKKNLSKSVKF